MGTPCRRLGSRWAPWSVVRAVPAQGMDEHKLGPPMFAIAVAAALAAEAAGPPDLDPVRGAVDGAAEAGWVDERFQQQQSMAEPGGPVADQAARAQRQHPRAEVTGRAGQEQEAGVVGEQMQPVELHGEAPANPPVARGALQRRRREHHQRQPLAAMMGDVAQCLADSRQRTEVVVRLHQARNRASSCAATRSTTTSDRATNAAMPPCSRWCRCIRARGECPVLRLSHWEDSESHAVQISPASTPEAPFLDRHITRRLQSYGPLRHPDDPAGPSRDSGWCVHTTDRASRVATIPSSMRAAAITPAGLTGAFVARFPASGSLPRLTGGSAPALLVSRPAQRSLALRPAWSLGRPRRPVCSECFRPCRYPHHPLRLLPAGATVAGRDSHPLRDGAFPRHTVSEWVAVAVHSKRTQTRSCRGGR